MTIKKPVDLITAAVLLVGTGFVYRESLSIDTAMVYAYGPLFYPKILMAVLVLLSVCLGLQSIGFSGKREANPFTFAPGVLLMQTAFIGLVIVYLLVLPYLGYIASTIAFLLAEMLLLGNRRAKDIALYAAVACGVTGILYYIFAHLLLLFLP